jgi:hypothetical protein
VWIRRGESMEVFSCVNYAGVPMILKKYQHKLFGHNVTIVDDAVVNREDTTNYYEYDNEIIRNTDGWMVLSLLEKYAKQKYDLYHLHGFPVKLWFVPWLTQVRRWHRFPVRDAKLLARFIHDTPAILHLHGYESKSLCQADWDAYDAILCSTPDLWQPGMIYLPNPIDTELWKYRKHTGNKALWFKQWAVDEPDWNGAEKHVRQRAKELGFDLTVLERWHNFRPYMSMPEFYHNWDILIEYKPGSNYEPNKFNEPALGLAALECMASGLKVYFLHDDKYLHWDDFKHHDAKNVVNELEKIYKKVTQTP